jgi:uncharacterized protein (DUF2235 family)
MPRRLIVCSDGTWDKLGHKDGGVYAPSNVAQMARSIAAHGNGMEQIVFYDPGVGTGNAVDRWTGGAMGMGLSDNVQDGYQFLMHNYAQGDEIYLFGFSRGAYTVRSLAGLIRKCGLLRKEYSFRIVEAYDIYRIRNDTADSDRAQQFRTRYSWHPMPIKFIGVWDTVGALGLPGSLFRLAFGWKYRFHDVTLSSSVAYAYHALAVDEKRRFFAPTIWEQSEKGRASGQTLEQVWFPGVHSDVGGGYAVAGLSSEAFHWMSEKAAATGLALDAWVPPGDPLDELHESWTLPYSLVPKFWRPIAAKQHTNESISGSAIKRWHDGDKRYRPPNLVRYFEEHGGPPPRPSDG